MTGRGGATTGPPFAWPPAVRMGRISPQQRICARSPWLRHGCPSVARITTRSGRRIRARLVAVGPRVRRLGRRASPAPAPSSPPGSPAGAARPRQGPDQRSGSQGEPTFRSSGEKALVEIGEPDRQAQQREPGDRGDQQRTRLRSPQRARRGSRLLRRCRDSADCVGRWSALGLGGAPVYTAPRCGPIARPRPRIRVRTPVHGAT